MAYKITKSTVECYKIRQDKGFYWADIVVDHNGNKGRISIASDFGSYQYYWGACGSSFKEFLCGIGIDYAAAKFGAGRWFDLEKTIKMYKEGILEYRRMDRMDKDYARKLFNSIKKVHENCDGSGEETFYAEMQRHDELMKYYDWMPTVGYDITPQFKNFWKELWPVFVGELKNEIKSIEVDA